MKLLKILAFTCLVAVAAMPLSAGSLSPCGSVAGNLVANCGFESGNFTSWTTGGNFEDTEVVSSPFYVYSGANSGSDYAVLGPVGSDATLSQTLSTAVGGMYTFSFYFASVGDSPADFTASWDGTPLLSLVNPNTGSSYTQYQYAVTGTGSDAIQFTFRDDPAYMALDDVVVGSTTPEPGTVGMLIGGLGLVLAGLRRRKV